MPQPFDIVLLRFPFTDLSGARLRPVLVLTRPNGRGDFVAVQGTSQVNHEVQVVIDNTDFALGELPKPSIVRPDKIFTLNQDLIARRVGRVNDDAFSRILTAVCQYLSCKR